MLPYCHFTAYQVWYLALFITGNTTAPNGVFVLTVAGVDSTYFDGELDKLASFAVQLVWKVGS